ncbi:hypothetical protein [Sinorhizobium fredii]|uniref:hypothetical protein n=1 Tax=Rhizobium fredii TaxID=380 RepID=UPI001297B51B|nr:hypothetical protein [Sinorhizobium fredii]MQW97469.1 hypothetical protein [Sinorhizobium fredii]
MNKKVTDLDSHGGQRKPLATIDREGSAARVHQTHQQTEQPVDGSKCQNRRKRTAVRYELMALLLPPVAHFMS